MSGHAMRPQEAGTNDRSCAALGEASWRRHACPGPFLRTKPAAKSGALAAAILERNAWLTWRLEQLRARPDNGATAVGAGWALRRYRRGGEDVGSAEEADLPGLAHQGADAHGSVAHATAAHDTKAHDIPGPAATTLPADQPAGLDPSDPGGGHAVDIEDKGHVPRSAAPPVDATALPGPGTRAALPGLYGSVPGAGASVHAYGPAFHAAQAALAFRSAAFRSAAFRPAPAAPAPWGAASGAAAPMYASAAPFDFPLAGRAVSARWGAPPARGQEAFGRLPAGPGWTSTLAGPGLRQSTPRATAAGDSAPPLPATYCSLPPAGVVTAVAVAAKPSGNKAAAEQAPVIPAPSATHAWRAMGAGVAARAIPGPLQLLDGRSADRTGGRAAASPQTAGLANVAGIAPTTLTASAASKVLTAAMPLDSEDRPQRLQAVRRLQVLRGQPGVHSQAAASIPRPLAARAGLAPLQRSVEARWPALAPLTTAARGAIAGSPSQEHGGGAHAMRVLAQRAGPTELPYVYGPGAGTAAAGLAPGAAAAAWDDGGSSWTGPGAGWQGAAPVLPAAISTAMSTTISTAIPAALPGEIPGAPAGEIPAAIPSAISSARPDSIPDSIPGAVPPAIPESRPEAGTRAPGFFPGRNSVPGLDVNDAADAPEQAVIGGEAASALSWRSRVRLAETPLPGMRRQIAAAPWPSMPHRTGGRHGPPRPAGASRVGHALPSPLPLAMVPRRAWPSAAPGLAPAPEAAGAAGAHSVQPPSPAPLAWPGDTHPGPATHATGGWTGAASIAAIHGVVPVSSEAGAAGQGPSHPHGAIGAELDLEQLSEHIWQSIMDKLVVEQERRGTGKWP